MPRTRAIFDFVFSLPRLAGDYERRYIVRGPAATAPYRLTYLSAPDGIADPHLLAVRQQKEASALAQFQDSLPLAVHSFQELHRWIFTQHNAYASKRLLPKEEQTTSNISEELLKTY